MPKNVLGTRRFAVGLPGVLRLVLVSAGIAVATQACGVSESGGPRLRRAPSSTPSTTESGRSGDPCAPGAAPNMGDDPIGTCATMTEYHVPDLTSSSADLGLGSSLGTRNLRPLVVGDPAGATGPSCAGTGPGINTCGPNGDDSCCAIATVPGGKASTLDVEAFDLGVYEVTSGRFAKFVEATGGNLRAAAEKGNWAGWDPKWTAHLPASRDEVDTELGPACQFRSDVRNFGALTWPSADIEAAVAELITDNNEDAADIRADATAARLHMKPINCVSYWIASAFCAWDGGRLPNADEWAFAAMGGDELRQYAWPDDQPRTADKLVTDLNLDTNSFTYPEGFPFFGNGMNAYHIAPPGRKPAGVARWGHHDMSGNLVEWTSENVNDQFGTVRGGSWEGHEDKNTIAKGNYPLDRTYGSLGLRCAYGSPAPAKKPEPPKVGKVAIHRSFNAAGAEHLFATAPPQAGTYEGVAFRLLSADPGDGSVVPLVACVTANGHHFLSSEAGCEGNTSEGVLGFSRKSAAAEMMPIYRCLGGSGDHLTTATPDECTRAGYKVEGLQGFAFGPPPSDFIATLYREGLGRSPEAEGHVAWTDLVLKSGGCNAGTLATAIEGILASAELDGLNLDVSQKVTRLYRAGLGRDPEPEGRANAEAALENGTSWKDLVHGVATSPEAAGYAPTRCAP